ncbi:twin-arginine translocase subunit TatC [bacterium]|nr:twin-arginine translocase subunit TatC [bacterium]
MATPEPEATKEPKEGIDWDASLYSHLREVKRRLMWYALGLIVTTAICYEYAGNIYGFLLRPLSSLVHDGAHKLMFTNLPEAFITHLTIAVYGGFFLSFPLFAYHLYRFCAPGLYGHEKRMMVPILTIAPMLFLLGAALAYYGIFPMAWKFFLSFEQPATPDAPAIILQARMADYLELSAEVMTVFGLTFQMPLVLAVMARMGLVTGAWLAKKRRYAIVIIFGIAAVITPPDVFSQIGLALPLCLLYEITIIVCRWMEPKAEKIIPTQDMMNHA